jgi:ATP-dependent DNA helicase PIF1
MLAKKNSHPFDTRIKFQQEGHVYWINNDPTNLISATTLIKRFHDEFDADSVVEKIMNKYDYNNNPEYKYYKMHHLLIKKIWEDNRRESSELGTLLHADIEKFYNDEEYQNESMEFQYFLNFYKDHPELQIYRTEFLIFSEEHRITGSVDALFKNIDGTFSIGDWKRSKEIKTESYQDKRMNPPFEHFPDENFFHYSLQLNLYRIILEKFYDFRVTELFLVVCHPNNENYIKYEVDIMEKEANDLLEFRKQELAKKPKIEIVKEKNTETKIMNNNSPEIEIDDDDYEPYESLLMRNKPIITASKEILVKPIIDENPLANKGKKWIDDDDKTLMEKAKNGEKLEELSKIYKRTVGSIKLRIIHNILKGAINDEDILEYCKSLPQVKEEDVWEQRKKEELKNAIKKEKQEKKKINELDELKFKAPRVTSRGLSQKQQQAYDLIMKGKNVFLTSPGGYGKSHLIKKIAYEFRSLKIGITSTTGVSAILLGGSTLHSFLGIGLGSASVEKLYMLIKNKPYINKRWKELDVLVIDEISMLDPALLDKLELLARKIRKNEEPFGGIQIILSGDFYQLPVVGSEFFCFDAECWSRLIPLENIIELDVNFRQGNNQFQRILNEIRIGEVSDESMEVLRTREDIVLENEYGIIPTKIFALNRDVDEYNDNALNDLCLKNPELEFLEFQLTYDVMKTSMKNFDFEEKLRKNCNVPFTLQLCVGAQVMLLYNVDLESGLCNGSRGVVVGFDEDLPLVKFLNGKTVLINYQTWTIEENNGEPILIYTQIPLRISYAITNHKSQGCSLDYVDVDLKSVFADGQSYVGLSRVRTLEGLSIRNLNRECFRANPRVKEFYNSLK